MRQRLKVFLVVVAAVVLTTLAIEASDILQGVGGSLTGSAIDGTTPCGVGASLLLFGDRTLCIDTYEASPSVQCPVRDPQNQIETAQNIRVAGCQAASAPQVTPWRFVSLTESQQLCARAGKRLLQNSEWYKAASGLDQTECATDEQAVMKSGQVGCVSPAGVHDMVGNVWEWLDEEVISGNYHDRTMPPEGYVALVDRDGVVVETSDVAKAEFGDDYAWVQNIGVRGMIRGGFYGSDSDAGLFSINAAVPLDFRSVGVGFRCVRDIY